LQSRLMLSGPDMVAVEHHMLRKRECPLGPQQKFPMEEILAGSRRSTGQLLVAVVAVWYNHIQLQQYTGVTTGLALGFIKYVKTHAMSTTVPEMHRLKHQNGHCTGGQVHMGCALCTHGKWSDGNHHNFAAGTQKVRSNRSKLRGSSTHRDNSVAGRQTNGRFPAPWFLWSWGLNGSNCKLSREAHSERSRQRIAVHTHCNSFRWVLKREQTHALHAVAGEHFRGSACAVREPGKT